MLTRGHLDAEHGEGQQHKPCADHEGTKQYSHCDVHGATPSGSRPCRAVRRPEYEDEHKQREGQHIFIVAGEVTGGEALRQPKHKTAQHGPRNGAYASENRRGEGFHPGQKPDGEAHLPGAGGNKRAAQRGKGGSR